MTSFETSMQYDAIVELDIHEECKKKCRSSILWQYIERYPQALAQEDSLRSLPLHTILKNSSSKVEDALMIIDKYPPALEHVDHRRQLPLHIECSHRGRSSIIIKCIEQYPDCLVKADDEGYLPLHWLLSNEATSLEDALMMIEKHPAALRFQNDDSNHPLHLEMINRRRKSIMLRCGRIPLHIECKNRCRSSIISKCIELYPETMAVADELGNFPLFFLLENTLSTVEDALKMIENYPQLMKRKNSSNDFPLHMECKNLCRSSIISKCIELYPQALSKDDINKNLPLHLLLMSKSSTIDDALMMIEKYPEALRHLNAKGLFPLHIECKNQCRSSIISKCIEIYPQALERADDNGYLPLHLVVDNKSSPSEITSLMMEKYSEALQVLITPLNILPLHIECQKQCRSSIISKSVKLYPQSVIKATSSNLLALHISLSNKSSSIESASTLIEIYPASLQHQSNDGYLPIHIECLLQCRSAILSMCIELYPESLSRQDNNGSLPLHSLLRNRLSSTEDALMMIEKYPAATHHQDDRGYLPLHTECMYRCRRSIISKFIDLYPESVQKFTKTKYLPLHVLLWGMSSVDVALMMLEKYPAALNYHDDSGLFPLHIECMRQCRSAIIAKCIEVYPEALSKPDKRSNLPLHCLLWNGKSSINDALMMIEKYPAALKYRDAHDNLPLHIECESQCRLNLACRLFDLYLQSPKLYDAMSRNNPVKLVLKRMLKAERLVGRYKLLPIVSYFAKSDPSSFAKLALDPQTGFFQSHGDEKIHRLLFNILSTHMLSPEHLGIHNDYNWRSRSSLIQLLLQAILGMATNHQLQVAVKIDQVMQRSSASYQSLLYEMMGRSSLVNVHGYAVCQGDELGDHLLRHVISYL
jgi:ankyrin repeat protein